MIGATSAFAAVGTCSFSGGVLTVGITGATTISQSDPAKNILLDGLQTDAYAGCNTAAAANVGNTTAINVTGPAGVSLTNESLTDPDLPGRYHGQLGQDQLDGQPRRQRGSAAQVILSPSTTPGNTDAGVTIDWGVYGVDLNGDGDLDVVLGGIETSQDFAGIGKVYPAAGETVNAGGSTATGAAYGTAITIDGTLGLGDNTLTGGAGSDSITGGAGDDFIAGGLGNDSLDGGRVRRRGRRGLLGFRDRGRGDAGRSDRRRWIR